MLGIHGRRGPFCTITSSNVNAIEVDSRVIYLTACGSAGLDTDVILEPPGPGNNRAFGHCTLWSLRQCTFSGGTGKFTWFHASVDVSHTDDYSLWYWEGTYSFRPQDCGSRMEPMSQLVVAGR